MSPCSWTLCLDWLTIELTFEEIFLFMVPLLYDQLLDNCSTLNPVFMALFCVFDFSFNILWMTITSLYHMSRTLF